MGKRIWICAAALLVILLGMLIWQLDIANWQGLDLKKIQAIPESTLVYDANGQSIGALYDTHERRYTELSKIPKEVVSAFITAEDQRFFDHSGVDVRRIFGALWHDIKTMSLEQGASTITQQLIKLTHLSSEKTLARKAQEIILALQLEKKMSKNEILEAYLNTVYFGNGAYGIGTAAQVYFGKDVPDLTLAEGALLAGIIKSPSNYAPHRNPEKALQRRDNILNSMKDSGVITDAEYNAAREEPLSIVPQNSKDAQYGWYMDQVILEAENALEMDAEAILSAGLHIYTGLEPTFQQQADVLFSNGANFPDPAADGTPVQAALVALDTQTGEIAAITGGRDYEIRRGLNRATQIQRQPGSAIKPISTYAAAIEEAGFLPTSTVQDVQREFPGKYIPRNAGGSYYGTVTLRDALSRSLNVATVDLADLIGMQKVRRSIASFGIDLAAQDVNLSLSLGSMTHGVSPAKLCAAYCALANGGTKVHPHAIRRITDRRGKILYEFKAGNETVISEQTAFLITDMLKTATETGSANALADSGLPIMGKTGTVGESTGGNRDIWTVAATPELAIAVWMGFDEPNAEHAIPDWAGGSSYPAQLCAAMFKDISPELSKSHFPAPEGLIPRRIDLAALEENHTVLLAAPNTPEEYTRIEWFTQDQLPTETSTLWQTPKPIEDLMLLGKKGDPPAIAFTAHSKAVDYLILRKSEDQTEIVATLNAEPGNVIVWSDVQADPNGVYSYSVLPRHRLFYEHGTLVTGPESTSVTWAPDGILNRIFGIGTSP